MHDRLARFSLFALSALFLLSLVGGAISALTQDAYSRPAFLVGTLLAAACGVVGAVMTVSPTRHAWLVNVLSRFATVAVLTGVVVKIVRAFVNATGFATGEIASVVVTVLANAVIAAVAIFAAAGAAKEEVSYSAPGWGLNFVVGATLAYTVLACLAVVFLVGRVNVGPLEAWIGFAVVVGTGVVYAVVRSLSSRRTV